MVTAPVPVPISPVPPPVTLTVSQFYTMATIPPEFQWFANLPHPNTRRAYRQDIDDFMTFAGLHRPEQFQAISRERPIAWRERLVTRQLANDTIRRKLADLSSLYAYLCERHAVLHNPVLGVKRPRSMNHEGVAGAGRSPAAAAAGGPARGDAQRPTRPRHPGDAALSRHPPRRSLHAQGGRCPAAPGRTLSAPRREGVEGPLSRSRHRGPAADRSVSSSGRARQGPGRATVLADQEQHHQNIVKHYAREVGLLDAVPGLCVHSLRAIAATNALENKADIAKVQVWLGHANISTTRMYDKRQSRPEDSPTYKARYD
jgi:integrase